MRDIQNSIQYYKEASSFNNQYAKNNLGIIYKNGFEDKINPNIDYSIEYLIDAIYQKNDVLSMFNLAKICFYENPYKDKIDEAIYLLIKSSEQGFYHSQILLCLLLIQKVDFNFLDIEKELYKYVKKKNNITVSILETIATEKL